jgi:hypothetical protein
MLVTAADDVFFQAAEQRGKASAAAESDNAESAFDEFLFGGAFFRHSWAAVGQQIILQKIAAQGTR